MTHAMVPLATRALLGAALGLSLLAGCPVRAPGLPPAPVEPTPPEGPTEPPPPEVPSPIPTPPGGPPLP
ncbi:MAG: hypothetical protein Q8P41_26635 [Pseudomonadota bacterium]|nr:hypothetical protein [Pseudomonadota bacterium]